LAGALLADRAKRHERTAPPPVVPAPSH